MTKKNTEVFVIKEQDKIDKIEPSRDSPKSYGLTAGSNSLVPSKQNAESVEELFLSITSDDVKPTSAVKEVRNAPKLLISDATNTMKQRY